MENIDMVRKIIGSTTPIGESNEDRQRLINLIAKIDLVDELVDDIIKVSESRNVPQESIRNAGKKAHKFLMDTLKVKLENV